VDHCFVIQPFDGGPFDRRFDDVVSPAIEKAGLSPYRVDRDPSVAVPIEAIESGIREARACVADITTDNPNVWFELGHALASSKPVILICSKERIRFPFDIQHRHLIRYSTDSISDFATLGAELSARLTAAMAKESQVESLAQATLRETEGLDPHEIAALAIIAEGDLDPDSYPSAYSLKQDMGKAGYREIAAVLAVKSLLTKGFVGSVDVRSYNNENYVGYHLLENGTKWLIANRDRLVIRQPPQDNVSRPNANTFGDFPAALDDDLPFGGCGQVFDFLAT
jgi:hypothetical protein